MTYSTPPKTPSTSDRPALHRWGLLTRPVVAAPLGVLVVVMIVVAAALVTRRREHDPALAAGVPSATAGTDGAVPAGTPPLTSSAPGQPPSNVRTPGVTPAPCRSGPDCPSSGLTGARPPVRPAAGKQWALTFDQEFNGSDYDHHKLTPCFDWNDGDCTATFNHGREHYEPSQVKVSDGTAKLIAQPASKPIPSSSCRDGSCTYVAGLLSTARAGASGDQPYLYKFTYGYVESRFKFPATRGFFTAFWMLPADPSYDYNTEIDILELLGDDPTTMYMTYSYQKRAQAYNVNTGKHHNGACPAQDYSKGFVDMAVDWEPNRIAWYINGVQCAEYTDAAEIEHGPMQILLNMMVDNDWQRQWDVGLTDPTLKRQLEVDYIRVYQQRPA